MSDRHFDEGRDVPSWAKNCKHCGRPVMRYNCKFGSNACRQAAYRKRQAERYTSPRPTGSVTPSVPAPAPERHVLNGAPPSAEKTVWIRGRRRSVTPKAKVKGGAA